MKKKRESVEMSRTPNEIHRMILGNTTSTFFFTIINST